MSKNFSFFFLIALFALAKLGLVSTNEIAALPYDSEEYVKQAASSVWTLGAPSGYPIWLIISKWSGFPQRILIEVLFAAASLSLCMALRRDFGRVPALILFAVMLALPTTYFMFDYALSDGFYACLNIFALAASYVILTSNSTKRLIATAAVLGFIFGWMLLTRNEDPLIISWLICLFVWASLLRGSRKFSQCTISRGSVLIAGCIAAVFCVGIVQAISLGNYLKVGVYARNLSTMPSHLDFLKRMASIDTNTESMRYVPVSANARELAYSVSPSLSKFKEIIENREGLYQAVSRKNGIPVGEIGAGWIWHIFNNSLMSGMNTADVGRLDGEYRKINRELDEAFDSGRLTRKFILHPFIAAPPLQILARLPSATWLLLKRTFSAYPFVNDTSHEASVFDKVLLRRATLIGPSYAHIVQGWAFVDAPGRAVKKVVLVSPNGTRGGEGTYFARPDVVAGYMKQENRKPNVLGFRFQLEDFENGAPDVLYVLDNGEEVLSNRGLAAGNVSQFSSTAGVIVQGIDMVATDFKAHHGFRHDFQMKLTRLMNSEWTSKCIEISLGVVALLSIFLLRSESNNIHAQFFLFVLLMFLLRLVFYSLIDSEAWAVETRYMLAASTMFFVCLSLSLGLLVSWLIKFSRR